jgi:hypothetical protein
LAEARDRDWVETHINELKSMQSGAQFVELNNNLEPVDEVLKKLIAQRRAVSLFTALPALPRESLRPNCKTSLPCKPSQQNRTANGRLSGAEALEPDG